MPSMDQTSPAQPSRMSEQRHTDPGVEITVKDLATGKTETSVIRDNYVIVTSGSCEVTSVSTYGNGTHQLTVKRLRPASDER